MYVLLDFIRNCLVKLLGMWRKWEFKKKIKMSSEMCIGMYKLMPIFHFVQLDL